MSTPVEGGEIAINWLTKHLHFWFSFIHVSPFNLNFPEISHIRLDCCERFNLKVNCFYARAWSLLFQFINSGRKASFVGMYSALGKPSFLKSRHVPLLLLRYRLILFDSCYIAFTLAKSSITILFLFIFTNSYQ